MSDPVNSLRINDFVFARDAYLKGANVTEFLKNSLNMDANNKDIIEYAYDLQSGSYIDFTKNNLDMVVTYTRELSQYLNSFLEPDDILMDVGCGELTTLSLIMGHLEVSPKKLLAFDISWSRINVGRDFFKVNVASDVNLIPFVAAMEEIPLPDKSVDIAFSSHALEPNGHSLKTLVRELFRVTRKKLILFEPHFENNSPEGKERMERLGYIKDLEGVIVELGGRVVLCKPLVNIYNPLNPTSVFVVDPPDYAKSLHNVNNTVDFHFSDPGTNYKLNYISNAFMFSDFSGFCYPVLRSIPILKSSSAILASGMTS